MFVPSVFSNNFLEDFFDNRFSFRDVGAPDSTAAMNADIQEFEDRFQLELELPGLKKEDIRAELKDGYLVVRAKREDCREEQDENGRYIRRERYCGAYQRSFYVGKDLRQEDIKAGFENGILTIQVPKKVEKPAVKEKQYIAIEG